jgi:hypothetical protein
VVGVCSLGVTGQAQCGGDKHCLRHLYILEVLLGSASIVPLTQQWSSAILRHVRSAGFSLSHRQERACIGAAEECGDATAAHALRLCAEPPSAKSEGYATPPAAKKWAKIASAGGSGFERGAEDDSHCLDSKGEFKRAQRGVPCELFNYGANWLDGFRVRVDPDLGDEDEGMHAVAPNATVAATLARLAVVSGWLSTKLFDTDYLSLYAVCELQSSNNARVAALAFDLCFSAARSRGFSAHGGAGVSSSSVHPLMKNLYVTVWAALFA